MANETVHATANRIVAVAREHASQVVIENLQPLTSRAAPRGRSPFNRMLNRSQLEKLRAVLDYNKLAVAGLPAARTAAAPFTSQTCPRSPRSPADTV